MQENKKKQRKFNKTKLNKVLRFNQFFKSKCKTKFNKNKSKNKLLNKA